MAPIISAALSVIAYLVANKDTIKQVVLNVEQLIPDAPGAQKAAAVRTFIGSALSIEAQIEAAWPMVAPLFNLFVAEVKKPTSQVVPAAVTSAAAS